MTTVAGDRGVATRNFLTPYAVAPDRNGNLYFSQDSQYAVWKLDSSGKYSLFAGSPGTRGTGGDTGPALAALFMSPPKIGVDAAGNVYLGDVLGRKVRKVTPDGTIVTIAGTGTAGYAGDGGLALSAQILIADMAVDAAGNVYIADDTNHRVRKIGTDGYIHTVVGNGDSMGAVPPDGSNATGVAIPKPTTLGVDETGALYVYSYFGSGAIYKVVGTALYLVKGSTSITYVGSLLVNATRGVCWGNTNTVNCLDSAGTARVIAGNPAAQQTAGDGGPASAATFYRVLDARLDHLNNIYLADYQRIRKIDSANRIDSIAGGTALLGSPSQIALSSNGTLFFIDANEGAVRRVATDGKVTTVADSNTPVPGAPAGNPKLGNPDRIAADSAGNVYIWGWARLVQVTPSGVMSIRKNDFVVGTESVVVRPNDDIYLGGYTVGRLLSGESLQVIAGDPLAYNEIGSGDGGDALAAILRARHMAAGPNGEFYIGTTGLVRKIQPGGTITAVAGNGNCGDDGDGGPGTQADLCELGGLAADQQGNVYISEPAKHRVRRVDTNGTISTFAGVGVSGASPDGMAANRTTVSSPVGLAVDAGGGVLMAESGNAAVRRIVPGAFCNLALSATVTLVDSYAGNGSLAVTTATGCSWTALSEAPWLHVLSGSPGSGSGTVQYAIDSNTQQAARTGVITIRAAGTTVRLRVYQSGAACQASVSTNAITDKTSSFYLTFTPSGCGAWQLTASQPWVRFDQLRGTGNRLVSVSFLNNVSTAARTATITVAGQEVTVTQAAASITLESPAPGSRLTGSPVVFTLASQFPSNEIRYKIGSKPGYYDLSSGLVTGTSTFGAAGIPCDGRTVYATIFLSGGMYRVDPVPITATYTSCSSPEVKVVSATPTSGTGSRQTFTVKASNNWGASDLRNIWLWIAGTFTPGVVDTACLLQLEVGQRNLRLANDSGAWLGPEVAGSAKQLSNNRCALDLFNTTVTTSGNDLTLNLPVTFTSAFNGAKGVWAYADGTGAASGWQQTGTWTVQASGPVAPAVAVGSASPASGSGTGVNISFSYNDSLGAADLNEAWIWIAESFTPGDGSKACLIRYNPKAGLVHLLNDAGTEWSAGRALGTDASLVNSRCAIRLLTSSATSSGENLGLKFLLNFMEGFAGTKGVWAYAAGSTANSGWQKVGEWTVPPPAVPTATVSAPTPSTGSSLSQSFVFHYNYNLLASNLTQTQVWFGAAAPGTDPTKACVLKWEKSTNLVYLLGDDGSSWTAGPQPTSSGAIANSRCSVTVPPGPVTISTNDFHLSLTITFLAPFVGEKGIWGYAASAVANSGWQRVGTWTVPETPVQPPTVIVGSSTPSVSTGPIQTFSIPFTDSLGAADVTEVWVWVAKTLTPGDGTKACTLRYNRASNGLYLMDNAGTGWNNPITPGLTGNSTNKRCTVYAESSAVVLSGNVLTLTLGVALTPDLAGVSGIWAYAAGSAANSGWQQAGLSDISGVNPPTVFVRDTVPYSGTGASQTFSFLFSDMRGADDISNAWMWIGESLTPGDGTRSCILRYERGSNLLYLLNDAGNAWSAGAVLGSGGSLANSRCSVALAGALRTVNYNDLTVTLPISFTAAFAGSKGIWGYAGGSVAAAAWTQAGSWTVPGTSAASVTVGAASPSSSSGTSATFSIPYSDSLGAADISEAWLWVAESFTPGDGRSACILRYNRAGNVFYLQNDSGTAWSAGAGPGTSTTLANSRCTVSLAGTSVVPSANLLTVNVAISFAGAFAGNKGLWGYAAGSTASSGWTSIGAFTVNPPVAAAITVGASNPNSGTGASQTFSYAFADQFGANDIAEAWVWIADTFTPGNGTAACILRYNTAANAVFVLNDAGTEWTPGGVPGSSTTVGNSRCTLSLAGSTAFRSQTVLIVELALTFAPAFSGAKGVWGYAAGSGTNSGWQSMGNWTVPAAPAPTVTVGSTSPASPSGPTQTFSIPFTDTRGAADLVEAWVWVAKSFTPGDGTKSCIVRYDRGANALFLINDAGSGWNSPVPLGSSNSSSNQRCTLNGAASSISPSGNVLTLTLGLTFTAQLAGNNGVWAYAASSTANSGWQQAGTSAVPEVSTPVLQVQNASPNSGTGSTQTFQFAFTDSLGAGDLNDIWVWVAEAFTPGDGTRACILRYEPASNRLFLLNDAGNTWSAGATPGGGGSLSNSRCAVTLTGTSRTAAGNTLSLTLPMTFTAAFAGSKGIWAYAGGASASSGWTAAGSWTVPGAPAPSVTVGAASPASGSGTSATLSIPYTDSLGAADISQAWLWIAQSFTPGNGSAACILRYDRTANLFYLQDDAGTGWTAGALPGSSTSLANSRCTINLAGTSVVPAGNVLTVNVAMSFAAGFAGAKGVWGYAGGSTASSGWTSTGAWTVTAPAGPTLAVGSASPASGSGASQTFSLPYTDSLGATDITEVWVWIAQSFTPGNGSAACIMRYNTAGNTIYMLNDAGSDWSPGSVPGSGATVANSRCTVSLAGSSVTRAANQLTFNLALTFSPAFSGAKGIWGYAAGSSTNSGWQSMGNWTVPAASAPTVTVGSTSPASPSGATQTFSIPFTDTRGAADVVEAWVWVAKSFTPGDGSKSCIVRYDRGANALYLINDAGTGWNSPVPLGSSSTSSNQRCTLNGAASSVSPSGNVLTLTLGLTFTAQLAGNNGVWAYAASGTANSGWQQAGTSAVPEVSAPAVQVQNASPNSGTGASQTFVFAFTDSLGAGDLNDIWVWVAEAFTPGDGTRACILRYEPGSNRLFLLNDAGNAWSAGATPGTGGSLSNSRCAVAMTGASRTAAGNTLSLTLPMTFTATFAGSKGIWAYAGGASASSGWTAAGSWTVPGAPAPSVTVGAASPASGSGSSATFSIPYTDSLGAADISQAWLWIAQSFTPGNGTAACILRYDRTANLFYLQDDAGTGWTAGALPGSSTSLANSRCTINLAGTSVAPSGNVLTVNVAVSFAAGFAGAKGVWGYAAGSAANSGWTSTGAWTVTAPAGPTLTLAGVDPASGSGTNQLFSRIPWEPVTSVKPGSGSPLP